MKHNEVLEITPNSLIKEVIIKEHYLKRWPSSVKNTFIVKNNNNELLGIITYSYPHSHTLKKGLAGKSYKNKILELSRLWLKPGHEKNLGSWFISKTLKMLKNTAIVVSFADEEQGHVGYIYQASNWFYLGKSKDIKVKVPTNTEGHHLQKIYGKTVTELEAIYGSNLKQVLVKGKHKYVYFLKDKDKLIKKTKLYSYPKIK